jgi:hypothetical protein
LIGQPKKHIEHRTDEEIYEEHADIVKGRNEPYVADSALVWTRGSPMLSIGLAPPTFLFDIFIYDTAIFG